MCRLVGFIVQIVPCCGVFLNALRKVHAWRGCTILDNIKEGLTYPLLCSLNGIQEKCDNCLGLKHLLTL